MVRQRPRKSVEELYATKFEANTIKSQVNNAPKTMRGDRGDRADYSGAYIITSTAPYNASCQPSGAGGTSSLATGSGGALGAGSGSMATGRRKTARSATGSKPDKYFGKDEKQLDDVKKEHSSKLKTARPDKTYGPSPMYNNLPNIYDNKNFVNFAEGGQKDQLQQPNVHHHHHHPPSHDDDKDDDTEEFFELIRQTVENAIGKSISDLLNRNFRELSAKVDRFSAELKNTNSLLNKLQTELNNKVVHYGEENSRHFRYLCMKSEYDKMFYQHHTMLASSQSVTPSSTPSPAMPAPPPPEKRPSLPKQNHSANDCEKTNPCSCRTTSKTQSSEPHKTSSEDRSMSQKSSEMGMREVLEHIQRFCTQMQLSDLKCDDSMPKSSFRLEDAMKINKQVFEDDDDDFQMSSDGMTPRSDEHIHKYGGTTMRSCATTRGNGGGDA